MMRPEEREPQGQVPALHASSGAHAGLPVDQQVAAAMQMQVEILRKINERQETLEDAIRDTNRSDMMISSTRALNESFRGMRRVQETLLDELRSDEGGNRGKILLFLGLVALALGIGWGFYNLINTVEKTGERLETAGADQALDGKLAALKAQVLEGISDDRQARLRSEVESRMTGLEASIADLRRERDQAREDRDEARTQLAEWKKQAESAADEARRLTKENLNDQRMISELSDSLAKTRGAPPARKKGEEMPAVVPETVVVDSSPSATPLTPARLEALNALLADHRGSEVYLLKSAGNVEADAIGDVVLEIRGQDGSVSRVVNAGALSFEVAARGNFLEMVFSKGSVAYHQGIGKVISSPFFRNVYKVGLFGINRQNWLSAGFSFVSVK